MLLRLLILLTVVPLIELGILLKLADRITWQWTVVLVVVTGALGAYLARREGLRVLNKVSADLSNGVLPARAVVDGMLVLVAGAFLVTPGLLTDLCGFGLLVPAIRGWVRRKLGRAFQVRVERHPPSTALNPFVDVVPSEARDVDSSATHGRFFEKD